MIISSLAISIVKQNVTWYTLHTSMVLAIIQSQILINQLSNLSINQQFQMADTVVNYVLSRLEENIYYGDPQGLKLYLQAKKEIYKEAEKLYISVSNAKDIIDHFISLAKNMSEDALRSCIFMQV